MQDAKRILRDIISIDRENQFLEYIVDRIQDADYRGMHVSQHNRFDLDRLTKILQGIYRAAGNDYFRVPLGDDIHGYRDSDCTIFYKIVNNVQSTIGMGTINSLKKNFFVDFQRMGLLERYNKNIEIIPNNKRSHVYWARLNPMAIKLISSGSLKERYRIFTDAIDNLFTNAITDLAEMIYYSDYKTDMIRIEEFMLILSDDRPGIKDKKIDLLHSYRSLERWQQDRAIGLIKEYCNPANFEGNKTKKRDYENWLNEAEQIFTLLKNTVYFDITRQGIKLNTGQYGIFEDTRLKQRGLGAKQEYFVKHQLDKYDDFELHHVIKLSAARNKVEFKLIDNWRNLVYISKDKHAEITRHHNKNKVLTATVDVLFFDDFDGNRIIAQNGISALYAGNLSTDMQNYNHKILKDIFGFGPESNN